MLRPLLPRPPMLSAHVTQTFQKSQKSQSPNQAVTGNETLFFRLPYYHHKPPVRRTSAGSRWTRLARWRLLACTTTTTDGRNSRKISPSPRQATPPASRTAASPPRWCTMEGSRWPRTNGRPRNPCRGSTCHRLHMSRVQGRRRGCRGGLAGCLIGSG